MLESQLAQTVDALDTHPPLAERLANLGLTEHDALSKSIGALAPEASAATLIGEALPSTARSVGVDWAVAIEAWWRAVYAHARTMARQHRLDRLPPPVFQLLSRTAWVAYEVIELAAQR
jgi:hypothetical protein